MLTMKRLIARSMPIALLVLGFVGGLAVSQINQSATPANSAFFESYDNQVLEISAAATVDAPVLVFSEPTDTSTQVDRLLWGDRVLWRGLEQTDAAGNRWIYVSLSEGVSGWMVWNITDPAEKIVVSDAVYTTPGIFVGETVIVSTNGAGANFRSGPSVSAGRLRGLTAGESLEVIGGPYQNELYVWWQLRDSTGAEGWVVDIEGWLNAQPAVE